MTISLYTASVPVFRQILGSLAAILAKPPGPGDAKNGAPAPRSRADSAAPRAGDA